jgi:hypothetical protein
MDDLGNGIIPLRYKDAYKDVYFLYQFLFMKYLNPNEQLNFKIQFCYSTKFDNKNIKMNHLDCLNYSNNSQLLPIHQGKTDLANKCRIYLNTRKYQSDCHPRPPRLLPVLITGKPSYSV